MSVLCKDGLIELWSDIKAYFTGTATPLMDGTATVGSSSKFARENHVHPSDTSKVDVVAGMGLSHNDFTDADKNKLDSLVAYSTMTAAEMEAGTDTTGKLVTAKDLHDVYVNVTGDTMTGDLTIHKSAPSMNLRDTRYTVGTAPAADQWGPRYRVSDSAGTSVGYLGGIALTSGRTGVQVETVRTVSGSNVYNGVALYIDASGNRYVTLSDPAAWRTALDVYSKTESDNRYVNVTGDTMTGTLTMSGVSIIAKSSNITYSGTTATTVGNSYLYFRENGNVTLGYVRSAIWAGPIYGVQIAGRNNASTVVENILSLRVSSGGARTVQVSESAPWRTALGVDQIIKKVSVTWSNQTLAGNSSAVITATFSPPSGYTFFGYSNEGIDTQGTTGGVNTSAISVFNKWTSGTTLNFQIANHASSQAKFSAHVDLMFVKTILYS